MNPYQTLALGIVKQAVDDWAELPDKIQKCKEQIMKEKDNIKKLTKLQGNLALYRGEVINLIRFFQSKWYRDLCDLLHLNYQYIKEKAGVNDDSIRKVKAL